MELDCGDAGACIKQACSFTSNADAGPGNICRDSDRETLHWKYIESLSPKRRFKALPHYQEHFLTQTDDDPFK